KLLALTSLKGQTRGCDIFEEVCDEMERNGLHWPGLMGVTTDGVPCMTGAVSGLVRLMKKRGKEMDCSEIINYHCIIHQEAIVSSVINLEGVMDTVVKCVNFIQSKGLNHHQFRAFLDEMDAQQRDVVYFSAVQWLSRGVTLKHFFQLRKKGHHLPQLTDEAWLCDLRFLVDVIGHLNYLNHKLQQGHFASAMFDHIKAFQPKIKLLQKHLSEGNFTHFPTCKELSEDLQEAGGILHCFTNTDKYKSLLMHLQEEFERRFQDFRSHENELVLFANPFGFDIDRAPGDMQLELIELQESSQFKAEYFYANLPVASFPHLRAPALWIASLFGSTIFCEKTFSLLNHNKSKYCSWYRRPWDASIFKIT
uniref:DUF4371 domain-containing protein n=1 Tax=Latimeria chalumnae TaxID=7897 RepID=H3AFH7_LATCH